MFSALNISSAMYAAYERCGNIYRSIIHLKIERSKNSCVFSVLRLEKHIYFKVASSLNNENIDVFTIVHRKKFKIVSSRLNS